MSSVRTVVNLILQISSQRPRVRPPDAECGYLPSDLEPLLFLP